MTIFSKGIDVSAHQGTIDWNAVRQDGVEFAILRAGFGNDLSQKDAAFDYNLAQARAAGLKIGVYWFSYATSAADAQQEAAVCAAVLQGTPLDYPVFFDWEGDSLRYCKQNGVNPARSDTTQWALAFLQQMQEYGYAAGLYSNPSDLNQFFDLGVLGGYPLWLAHWGIAEPSRDCMLWQYTSSASVSGIAGRVDANYSFCSGSAVVPTAPATGNPTATEPTAATTAPLRLRKDAHTAAEILQVIPQGASVQLLEDDQWGWSKVSYGGSVGWVSNAYLSDSSRSAYHIGRCNGSQVNFRSGDSLSAPILTQLQVGATFTIICFLPSGWIHANYQGREGYLYYDSSYLSC